MVGHGGKRAGAGRKPGVPQAPLEAPFDPDAGNLAYWRRILADPNASPKRRDAAAAAIDRIEHRNRPKTRHSIVDDEEMERQWQSYAGWMPLLPVDSRHPISATHGEAYRPLDDRLIPGLPRQTWQT